jgi:hypothetical protein
MMLTSLQPYTFDCKQQRVMKTNSFTLSQKSLDRFCWLCGEDENDLDCEATSKQVFWCSAACQKPRAFLFRESLVIGNPVASYGAHNERKRK